MPSLSKPLAKHVSSFKEIRELASNAEKAAFAHIHFKVGARDAKAHWNVGGGTFTRAVKALRENRAVGMNGRPRRFDSEQEQAIVDYVLKQADIKCCKNKSDVKLYVCSFSCVFSAIMSVSDM